MKKIGLILGGIVALILAAIIIIPLVVDVNKYNPQIVKAANEKLNGSLELGRLSLNLWGKIHVGVDGLVIRDTQKRAVVAVKDASFDMPYFSIFSGSPLVTLRMVKPEILVIKNKEGKLNVMNLMKPSAPEANAPAGATAGSPQKVELPSMAMNAHIGISIEDAKLVYKDEAMALSNTIDQFNLRVKDFSLTRKTEMEIWADLKTTMGTDLKVEGPLKLIVELTPEVSGGEFKSAAVIANFTADDLVIQKGDLFMKKKGIPANFKFDGVLGQENLKLNNAAAKFHNAEIVVSGNYHQTQGADIKFEAKPIDLKPWSELVPMLKEYELEGKIGLKGEVKGTSDSLQYAANLVAQNFAMKGPNLKAKPVINAEIMVATDRIEKFNVDLKGPGNELILNGKMLSFSKPQLTFTLTSPKGMDLDQWIEFPKGEAKATAKKDDKPAAGSSASGTSGKAADYDAMLDPLRKNEVAKAMTVDGSVSIAFMKAMDVRIDDISAKIQMKNLVAALTALKMKMYDGNIGGGFTVDLKPADPAYTMNLSIAGFDMQKAVESQFKSFKDTIIGKLTASMTGAGSSFNAEEIKRKLQLKGDFKLLNATFKTIDVARIANSAIGDAVSKLGGKVPGLQGKSVNIPANKESRYDVSSNFTLSGGTLDAPNFVAKALTGGSLDIRGSTKMGLVDESLDAKWELVDTQHTIPAVNIGNPIGGGTINNILAKGEKDPVILPINVNGKWSSPSPSYTATVEYLAGVAGGRLTKSVGEGAKAKATSAVQDAVKKAIGGGGNPLKGLFGH